MTGKLSLITRHYSQHYSRTARSQQPFTIYFAKYSIRGIKGVRLLTLSYSKVLNRLNIKRSVCMTRLFTYFYVERRNPVRYPLFIIAIKLVMASNFHTLR